MELAQSDAAAYMDWYRIETWKSYERPQSEVTGNASDNYERRAPGTAGMYEGVRYQMYESKDGHVLFMASEQAFWKNFCEGVGRMDMFEKWPGLEVRRPRAQQPRDAGRAPRHLQDADVGRMARVQQHREHPDRTGQHAEDDRRRPAVPGPLPVDPGVTPRRRRDAASAQDHRRGAARPDPRHRRSGSTPTTCSRRCSATTTPGSRRCTSRAPSGADRSVGRCLRGRRYSNSRVSRADRTRRPFARQTRRADAPPPARGDDAAPREPGRPRRARRRHRTRSRDVARDLLPVLPRRRGGGARRRRGGGGGPRADR